MSEEEFGVPVAGKALRKRATLPVKRHAFSAGKSEISPAAAQLLDELPARGIIVHDFSVDS